MAIDREEEQPLCPPRRIVPLTLEVTEDEGMTVLLEVLGSVDDVARLVLEIEDGVVTGTGTVAGVRDVVATDGDAVAVPAGEAVVSWISLSSQMEREFSPAQSEAT